MKRIQNCANLKFAETVEIPTLGAIPLFEMTREAKPFREQPEQPEEEQKN